MPDEHLNSIPTRRSLLSRLRNWDDKDSWRDFFETYWKLLYAVALKSGLSEAEAQDVVQETIIAVSKKMPGFKYDPAVGSFKGWLLHMTRWKIADQFRRRQRQEERDREAVAVGGGLMEKNGEFERLWDEEWGRNVLQTALARVKKEVNPKQYQIYDLYVLKEWPVERIVSTLRVSRAQVYLARTRITPLVEEAMRELSSGQ